MFVKPPGWNSAIDYARRDLAQARQAKVDLATGTGVFYDAEPGRAVRELRQAQSEVDWARQQAQHASGWRDRRAATKQLSRNDTAAHDQHLPEGLINTKNETN